MSFIRRLGDKYNIEPKDVQETIKEELNPEEERKTFSWRNFLDNVVENVPSPLNLFVFEFHFY